MKKRYQVLLEPEQQERIRRIAEEEMRSAASVLRQALDIGLDLLEGKSDVGEQRMKILERFRQRGRNLPLVELLNLVNTDREEREDKIEPL
jgi:hypothetical protein